MFENNIYHGEGLVTVLDYPAIAGGLNQVKIIRAHHHKSKFKIFLFLVVTTRKPFSYHRLSTEYLKSIKQWFLLSW